MYFVTLPHPKVEYSQCGVKLVKPESLSRAAVLEKLLASCSAPTYTDARCALLGGAVVLSQACVFQEFHKADQAGVVCSHFHIAVKAEASFRFNPVKKALLGRFGLASHWSCTHVGYWSPVRYCYMPSPKKPETSLDKSPLLWSRIGNHPSLHLCCHQPTTAAASMAKRQCKEKKAAESGKSEPRVTEYELWPIVVESKIRNTPTDRSAHLRLIQYAKSKCSNAVCAFLFKNRARLPALIDDIWQWETIDDAVAAVNRSRLETLHAAAASPCVCGGAWMGFALYSLTTNGINVPDLCKNIFQALSGGRGPTSPVIVLAGPQGGEGKSFFLKGLTAVFGCENVFQTPQHPTFPLLGLDSAKVVFMDDFRFYDSVLPTSTLCLWFDGSPVPVAKPQNVVGQAGQDVYKGVAPIFVTTKQGDLDALPGVSLIISCFLFTAPLVHCKSLLCAHSKTFPTTESDAEAGGRGRRRCKHAPSSHEGLRL